MLANPPLAGSLDYENCAKDLLPRWRDRGKRERKNLEQVEKLLFTLATVTASAVAA